MVLTNPDHDKKRKSLKNSKTGMEVEFHVIDTKGRITNKGVELLNALKAEGNIDVTPEIGSNMIEFGCYPGVKTFNPALNMISSVQRAYELAQEKGLVLYPFATYPGKFTPQFSDPKKYQAKIKIWGEKKLKESCQTVGFHHHYTLPKGVFDAQTKTIKNLRKSKLSRAMISSYNYEIAIDPILTLFTQSSPFYKGKVFAKDSRVVVYRGGEKLRYKDGVYANFQQVGALPPYKQTLTDLLTSLQKRWQRWENEIKKAAPSIDFNKMYPYKLDISWNPVKLNKHGTLEQRGMDTNYLSILTAVTVLLKFTLRKIQRERIEVLPTDYGLDEAFKIENGIMYIPPHTLVRNKLQAKSAYDGYQSNSMHRYAKRFLNFAQSITPKRYASIIRPVKDMVEQKRSMSDKIVTYAKRKGYLQEDGTITNEDAAQLSLHYADRLPKDLEKTKKKLQRLASL